jgi:hypothetical protein
MVTIKSKDLLESGQETDCAKEKCITPSATYQ